VGELAYSSRQVTLALQALARDFGDVDKTADRLINDEFQVPAETLYLWKTEVHAEQYNRLLDNMGHELERSAIQQLQQRITRTNELAMEMAERVGEITRAELTPQALRALTDASAKASTELMQLTGRPINGAAGDGSIENMLRVISGLQSAGFLKVAPSVAAFTLDAESVTEETNGA
jgi:hypothetical protein